MFNLLNECLLCGRLLKVTTQQITMPWLRNNFMLRFSPMGREMLKLKEELYTTMKQVVICKDTLFSALISCVKKSIYTRLRQYICVNL